jgi:hypothetical protein
MRVRKMREEAVEKERD